MWQSRWRWVAGCASRNGPAARSDKSVDGAIQFAAAQVVATGDLASAAAGHVDVWLDASGLPVEIVFQSAADKQSPGRTELHFSQWGRPVTITPPPADQVLTEQDQISFAIPGRQFEISGDHPDGPTFSQSGGGTIIGRPPSGDSGQPVCVPVSVSLPAQPAPTTLCVTLSAPTHT
ncbi:hypothetical protein [Catenulispora sp. EB89]|uniref:hypothetical protein n=1 Tax=Catenulispora sp. EB89 TaxID=3156257 RepID=UPI003518A782